MEFRRLVAVEKHVKDLDATEDSKVRVLGTIVNKDGNSIFLDDGTGTVRVIANPDKVAAVEEKQLIRVLGRVAAADEGQCNIYADIIQDMNGLNIKLHKTVCAMWEKAIQEV